MARSIITPDQEGKKITVRIKLPADPCRRCFGRCLERAPRFWPESDRSTRAFGHLPRGPPRRARSAAKKG